MGSPRALNFFRPIRRLAIDGSLWAVLVVGAAVAGMSLYMAWGDPREYWLTSLVSGEVDYYYYGRIILEELFPVSARHPGTPLSYVTSLLQLLVGRDFSRAQALFNVGYALILAWSLLALLLFRNVALRGRGFSFSLLVLTSIVLWPSFITFLNIWHPVAFVLTASAIIVVLFWRWLGDLPIWTLRQRLVIGSAIGATTAMWGAFLLVAMAMFVAALSRVWMERKSLPQRTVRPGIRNVLLVLTISVVVFLTLTAPVAPRLYDMIVGFLVHSVSDRPSSFLEILGVYFVRAAPFTALLTLTVVAIAVLATLRWWREKSERTSMAGVSEPYAKPPAQGPSSDALYELIPGAVLLAALLAMLLFLMGRAALGPNGAWDNGYHLRGSTPLAAVLPLGILYARRLWDATGGHVSDRVAVPASITMAVVSAMLLLGALVPYATWRHTAYAELRQDAAAFQELLERMRPLESRVAFTGAGSFMASPPSFHFRGNIKYSTTHRFDAELLGAFPGWTVIRWDTMAMLAGKEKDPRQIGLLRGRWQRLADWWQSLIGRRLLEPGELFTGEGQGVSLSLVVIDARTVEPWYKPTLLTALQERYERICQRSVRFGEMQLVLVALDGACEGLQRPSGLSAIVGTG